jgi:hypothetical protein
MKGSCYIYVVEPPELFRLKCASHRYTADTNSMHFKQNNPLVCRVSARCNHGWIGLKQVYLARRRVYNHTIAHQLLIHKIVKHYYKAVSKLKVIYIDSVSNDKLNMLVKFTAEEKLTRDYTHRGGWHHTQPEVWRHSGGSLPAGDGSHSTDQPNGTKVGHAGLSVGFSKVIPEKFTSKTEYTNT